MHTVPSPPVSDPPLPPPNWDVIDAWQAGFAAASKDLVYVIQVAQTLGA